MHAILSSKAWPYRTLRITALVAVGWWILKSTGLVYAQLPASVEWPRTDFAKTNIDLDEVMSGGPPKDGIPAIDEPKFISIPEADEWLDAKEPVIVVEREGTARAYPLQILMYHEIVNDTVAQTPLSVTFCPLCNASIVFDRRVDGKVLDFGTTGRLRKSDLVMYDRQTESWWQQFTGQGIVGDYTGTELTRVPATIVAFDAFRTAHPQGEVLSRDTGHRRPYGRNPYRGYDSIDDQPFLFRDPVDPRLPPMERVLNVSIGDAHKLYPFSVFEQTPVINDRVVDSPVVVFSREGTFSALDNAIIANSRTVPSASAYHRRVGDKILFFEARGGDIVDAGTASRWNLFGMAVDGPMKGTRLKPVDSGVHFAFAWLAFNPNSEIYAN